MVKCPITKASIRVPVLGFDSYIYESSAISTWFKICSNSPVTGEVVIPTTTVCRNSPGVDGREHGPIRDACAAIVMAAEVYRQSKDIRRNAINELCKIMKTAADSTVKRVVMEEPGVLDVMCTAWELFQDNVDLQVLVCRAAVHSVCGGRVDDKLCRVVCSIMRSYPEEREIQSYGCRLFMRTSVKKGGVLSDNGASGLVVDAMKRFVDDVCIQVAGCVVIADFAQDSDKDADTLSSIGAPGVVFSALQRFGAEYDVVLFSLLAISKLVEKDQENGRRLNEMGAIHHAKEARIKFTDNKVQEAANHVMDLLGDRRVRRR